MKAIIASIVLLFTTSIGILGQSISFTYDADGNMESRSAGTLKSSKNVDELITAIDSITVDLPAKSVNIYPNPTQGQVTIEITPLNNNDDNYYRLYSVNGSLIRSQKITSSRMKIEITGAQGIYLLDIHLGKDVSKWKIIKQK